MAWTFRRQIKLGPINLNFSRSGIGGSAGAGPFRTGVDAKGRHYTYVRGPFGLYNRQYHSSAGQASAPQAAPAPESVAGKDSLIALVFSAGAVIVLFNGAFGPENHKWLVLFILLTAIPAILGFIGYFGRQDATTGWFKAVAGVLSIEKWLLVGLLLLFFVVLAAGSNGRKRR
jgi:hypothetical protein